MQCRLMKTSGRLVKHARYHWLLLAEGHLHRRLFDDMLRRLSALPVPGADRKFLWRIVMAAVVATVVVR